MSHYIDTKIFFYQTDFLSEMFHETKINEDFRSYYLNKYNTNPKYCILTDVLKEKVFPKVRILTDFIPDIYFINSHNIEGSLVPLIIGEIYPDRKNLIISSEIYDSQYSYFHNFKSLIIRRQPGIVNIYYEPSGFIKMVDRTRKDDSELYQDVFNTYGMYCTLLSVLGDRYRSIDGITGIGTVTLSKLINDGIRNNTITKDSMNVDILSTLFTDMDKDEFTSNYLCTNISNMLKSLSHADKNSILTQLVDRSDANSVLQLNATMFRDYPILVEILLA